MSPLFPLRSFRPDIFFYHRSSIHVGQCRSAGYLQGNFEILIDGSPGYLRDARDQLISLASKPWLASRGLIFGRPRELWGQRCLEFFLSPRIVFFIYRGKKRKIASAASIYPTSK